MTIGYTFKLMGGVLISFCAVIAIPWWYDYANLQIFIESHKENKLIVREYANTILAAHLDNLPPIDANSQGDDMAHISYIFLKGKRHISLDYIHQMDKASKLAEAPALKKFGFLIVAIAVILAFLTCVLINKIPRHLYRAPIIGFVLFGSIIVIWFSDLPHSNNKFHIIFGIIYSILITLSDFLCSVDLGLDKIKANPTDGNWSGYLSALQYKHRYWTTIFNVSAAFILASIGTISFVIFELFASVFGEGFYRRPLVGTLLALAIAFFITFCGIFRPIRRHLENIEEAMASRG